MWDPSCWGHVPLVFGRFVGWRLAWGLEGGGEEECMKRGTRPIKLLLNRRYGRT